MDASGGFSACHKVVCTRILRETVREKVFYLNHAKTARLGSSQLPADKTRLGAPVAEFAPAGHGSQVR